MNSKLCPQLMNTVDGYKENNIMILSLMRLADVYLMYAEATAVGYNGPKGKAATYSLTAEEALNKIRERAGIALLSNINMEKVRHERRVELAFEGHRWFDLRRTTRPRIEKTLYSGQTIILEQNDERYTLRIPQSAIEANPNLSN